MFALKQTTPAPTIDREHVPANTVVLPWTIKVPAMGGIHRQNWDSTWKLAAFPKTVLAIDRPLINH